MSALAQFRAKADERPPDLKDLDEAELIRLAESLGEKPFRGRQLYRWIFEKGAADFGEMSDLPKELRGRLAASCRLGSLALEREARASDGTIKYVWRLADGPAIESVLIPMEERWTLCISTQAGCRMGCEFCLTARLGLVRNLTSGEVVDQFLSVRRRLPPGGRIHNIVLMGMGEPLDNFGSVVKACRILTDRRGFGVTARRLTLSTVGMAPRLVEFQELLPGVKVAVSLNAADDRLRSRLMPVNRKWNLEELLEQCRKLPLPRARRITFEYVLLGGLNDSPEDAKRLARLLQGIRCKVNLIPWNPFPGAPFERPARERVEAFQRVLLKAGYVAPIRESKGLEVGAACGQLAGDRGRGG